jgi:hypothetical protein
MFRPYDNSPTRLFCTRRCGQLNRWRELVRDGRELISGKAISALPEQAARRHWGRLSFRRGGGRPRNDDRPDHEDVLDEIRNRYAKSVADGVRGGKGFSERTLERLTKQSRRVVREALDRP